MSVPASATAVSVLPDASGSSISPVGLDRVSEGETADEEYAGPLAAAHLPKQPRRLRAIVFGAVAGCALILVAAGIARVSHASATPPAAAAVPETVSAAPPLAPAPPVIDTPPAAPAVPAPLASRGESCRRSPQATVQPRPFPIPHPRIVRRQGKKLPSASAVVSCGSPSGPSVWPRTDSLRRRPLRGRDRRLEVTRRMARQRSYSATRAGARASILVGRGDLRRGQGLRTHLLPQQGHLLEEDRRDGHVARPGHPPHHG